MKPVKTGTEFALSISDVYLFKSGLNSERNSIEVPRIGTGMDSKKSSSH